MLLIAIANGAARDLGYKKFTGDLAAHQISTLILILLFAVYLRFIIKKFPPESAMQAIHAGLFWLALIMCFEFGFGLMRGNSRSWLLGDYNAFRGRIWIVIPIWITVAPKSVSEWI